MTPEGRKGELDKIEPTLATIRLMVPLHQLWKDGDRALIVRGPSDVRAARRLTILGFKWDSKNEWRRECKVTRETKLSAKTVVDDCNNKLVFDRLSAVDQFNYRCLELAQERGGTIHLDNFDFSGVLS